MTAERKNLISALYGALLSLVTLALGSAFVWQVVAIYSSGPEKPYTREIAAAHLRPLLPIIIIWVLLSLFGLAFSVWAPEKKLKNSISPVKTLKLVSLRIAPAKLSGEGGLENQSLILKKYQRNVTVFKYAAYGFTLATAIYSAAYFFNVNNFPSVAENRETVALNAEVIRMAVRLIPAVMLSLALNIALAIYSAAAAKRALPAAKQLAAESIKSGFIPQKPAKNNFTSSILAARILIFIFAAAFIVMGIFNGGAKDVLIKAINICTECIGLG